VARSLQNSRSGDLAASHDRLAHASPYEYKEFGGYQLSQVVNVSYWTFDLLEPSFVEGLDIM
jgi:hypothetical protein